MSIINSLKTFSKKAFNVEPKGSNIDEVLDDMASKVTPGSGGGDASSIGYTFDKVILFNGEVEATVDRFTHTFSMTVEGLHLPDNAYPVVVLDNEEIAFIRYIADADEESVTFYSSESSTPALKCKFAEEKLELTLVGNDPTQVKLVRNIVVCYKVATNISTAFKGMIMSIVNEYNCQ